MGGEVSPLNRNHQDVVREEGRLELRQEGRRVQVSVDSEF
jgi:hypothetical protein